jgi:hypothetical protein
MRSKPVDEVYVLLNVEADRRLDGVAKRHESAVTRATVIIGAAVVIGGVQVFAGVSALRFVVGAWLLAAVVFAIIVALFGTGHELPLKRYEAHASSYSRNSLLIVVVKQKLVVLAEDEFKMSQQSKYLNWSYFSFTMALLYALIAVLLTV